MQKGTLSPIFWLNPEEQEEIIKNTIPTWKIRSTFEMKFFETKESLILKIKKFFHL